MLQNIVVHMQEKCHNSKKNHFAYYCPDRSASYHRKSVISVIIWKPEDLWITLWVTLPSQKLGESWKGGIVYSILHICTTSWLLNLYSFMHYFVAACTKLNAIILYYNIKRNGILFASHVKYCIFEMRHFSWGWAILWLVFYLHESFVCT